MSSRVGKRRRRVAAAEATLASQCVALHEEIRVLAADARAAATPGRVVFGGFALGALAGLARGRRPARARKAAAAGPGLVQSLTGMVRLVSMLMPVLAPLLGMAQAAAAAPTEQPPSEAAGGAPPP